MIKEKVLLAVDNIDLENYIMKQLSDEFDFCKPAPYRHAILSNIEKYKPNIVVIVEELKGKENMTKIIYEIFSKYSNVRIIFVANERQPGDKLLSTLINYQVYDLVIGDEISATEIIQKIRVKSDYKDVMHLHAVEIVDEEKGHMLFEAPQVDGPKEKIIEVIKEVYIETSSKNEQVDVYQQPMQTHIEYMQTSNEDLYLVVGNDMNGNPVMVKDVCPNGYYYYEGYFFNEKDDLDYYFYHEGYFFNQNNEPFVNFEGSLITYNEYLERLDDLQANDEFIINSQEQERLLEEERLKEQQRLEYEERLKEQQRLEYEERLREQERLEYEERLREQERLAFEERLREQERLEQQAREEEERLLKERQATEIQARLQRQQEEARQREKEKRYQEQMAREEELRRQQEIAYNKRLEKPNEPSEKERNNSFMKMFDGKTQNQVIQAVSNSNKKLITFLGAKGGTGATTIAFNTANALARENKNVLYIEYNYTAPSVPFLYNIGYANKGIDSAIRGLKETKLIDVEDAILRMSELKKKKIEGNPFKVFSENLDVLLFSKEFIVNHSERMKTFDESFVKELLLYFIFQSNYDFVILDMQIKPISEEVMYQTLFLSQKIFLVTLPDYAYVGHSTFHINEWANKSILLNNRLHLIVNRFEKSELTIDNLCDWLEVDKLIVFQEATKQCIEANLSGIPLILKSKKTPFSSGIAEILSYLK